ncbi:tRNA-(ms[2]io[6]A)-hydroxylase [Aliidiomarina taiwanensis]|uniref:tRNA-(Ms[2]io[6]A)-hydroxylase n=1 Tax=Aliidiomarina taiwanensis TaxID=946228 RepID=A0A432X8Z6_9GAMM|nr:tRNA isopentenyl-2-thiomethyl-A-37 hydroxylase MiaE [Aliidiomarina taiwanensis]RUO43796.1 tRNA-(ms[2]io[6]A)-hydroxylase [Aliidiomarina taiwanensis]
MSTAPLASQINQLLEPIHDFLLTPTPQAWLDQAAQPEALPLLLIDHLHCELKAAQSAALLLRRYILDKEAASQVLQWLLPYEDAIYRKQAVNLRALGNQIPRLKVATQTAWQARLVDRMVLLMKEELHHFTQVFEILQARDIEIQAVSASRYAAGLMRHARTHDPVMLVDKLIIGALIEARSCERFAALAPYLDEELSRFYVSLLRSEARHFEDYLTLAEEVNGGPVTEHVARLAQVEAELITTPDTELRFHSGVPS